MGRGRLLLISGTGLAAVVTVVGAAVAIPPAVRVAFGVPMILLLPGFALVCAVFPERQLSRSDRLIASVGTSLAVAACLSVLLGATPVGLSQESLAVTLGGGTVALSICAGVRLRHAVQGSPRNVSDNDTQGGPS